MILFFCFLSQSRFRSSFPFYLSLDEQHPLSALSKHMTHNWLYTTPSTARWDSFPQWATFGEPLIDTCVHSKEEQSDLSVCVSVCLLSVCHSSQQMQPTKVSNRSQINSIKCYIKCKPIEQGVDSNPPRKSDDDSFKLKMSDY